MKPIRFKLSVHVGCSTPASYRKVEARAVSSSLLGQLFSLPDVGEFPADDLTSRAGWLG